MMVPNPFGYGYLRALLLTSLETTCVGDYIKYTKPSEDAIQLETLEASDSPSLMPFVAMCLGDLFRVIFHNQPVW